MKAFVILILNLIFGVPLAVVLGITTFLVGFFPLIGEWSVYIPISIYLYVFRHQPVSALIYLSIGLLITINSSLLLRPKLASQGAQRFSFYWMLLALVAGVYVFGIPGIVLGPAILGFVKAVADTLFGNIHYETSLLKSEIEVEKQKTLEDSVAPPIERAAGKVRDCKRGRDDSLRSARQPSSQSRRSSAWRFAAPTRSLAGDRCRACGGRRLGRSST